MSREVTVAYIMPGDTAKTFKKCILPETPEELELVATAREAAENQQVVPVGGMYAAFITDSAAGEVMFIPEENFLDAFESESENN